LVSCRTRHSTAEGVAASGGNRLPRDTGGRAMAVHRAGETLLPGGTPWLSFYIHGTAVLKQDRARPSSITSSERGEARAGASPPDSTRDSRHSLLAPRPSGSGCRRTRYNGPESVVVHARSAIVRPAMSCRRGWRRRSVG